MEEKFQKIKQEVEKELSCSAHNIDHVTRVYNLCLNLAEGEDIDLDVLRAAALLHDIARVKEDDDSTGNTDHAILSSKMAVPILQDLGFSAEKIKHTQDCIISHRFRSKNKPEIKEAQILFDADKLDVLGALGVGRSFIMTGQFGQRMYEDVSVDEYVKNNLTNGELSGRIKDSSKHAPNLEFETKFKFIPEKLYTRKAKKIAEERLKFMNQFFKRLKKEINGEL